MDGVFFEICINNYESTRKKYFIRIFSPPWSSLSRVYEFPPSFDLGLGHLFFFLSLVG